MSFWMKSSRRIEKFEGDAQKFRSWMFDFLVTVGSIDSELAKELKELLGHTKIPEDFCFEAQVGNHLYNTYKGELFGILCQLTGGEEKM